MEFSFEPVTYCFKCGDIADYEIEVKDEDRDTIATKDICESCLMCFIGRLSREESDDEDT